ncbi:MAG: amidohydrolase family protein [Treponema sp.]|jgi:cytosine/adenosine deaminase-related metal-dependent hydrolase|nr:amidohydrolase family protein [Treponema sp.]
MVTVFSLKNGIVVSLNRPCRLGELNVLDGRIVPRNTMNGGRKVSLDLRGRSYIYPALINSHDHLQGNYLPAVGPKRGNFYLTWQPWDGDLKASPTFVERSRLSREELYRLSGYKNLFSGVATVIDHFPHEINREFLPLLPVRAVAEYTLSHEAAPNDLKWGAGIGVEHRRALKKNWPFVTHLAEGFDDICMGAVERLEKHKALDDHCLLVHCIALSDRDIRKIAGAGASVCWCPASNMRMFNVSAKVRKMLKAGINLSLGTDSSATGSVNLLEELRYARNLYRRLYGEELPARTLFKMVTLNAARALRIAGRTGVLDPGKLADLMLIKARRDDPFENLLEARPQDIELVVVAGRAIYGEERFLALAEASCGRVVVGSRTMFVAGDPGALYREVRRKLGFNKVLEYLPFEPEGKGRP